VDKKKTAGKNIKKSKMFFLLWPSFSLVTDEQMSGIFEFCKWSWDI
jgi:hypothetical protein